VAVREVLKQPLFDILGFTDVNPDALVEQRVHSRGFGSVCDDRCAIELETIGSIPRHLTFPFLENMFLRLEVLRPADGLARSSAEKARALPRAASELSGKEGSLAWPLVFLLAGTVTCRDGHSKLRTLIWLGVGKLSLYIVRRNNPILHVVLPEIVLSTGLILCLISAFYLWKPVDNVGGN
jgi:hypothetical protein